MIDVELQVIGSALRAVAEEMGAVLIRSAFSANIKERRDCSTAVFDEAGRMIAQAEHIPVHLGAMPDAVAAAMSLGIAAGEVCILNDPYTGGTHLPDVTLVSRTSLGYAVSRAHHADVGGMEPASLPAFSRELYQEGLIIPPTLLTEQVEALFVANARNPDERRGDLRAQISAHRLAERRIDELCERRGRERIAAAMDELYAYSARMVRAALARLPDGTWSAEDIVEAVEGELTIRATVEIAGDEIRIDFAGTDAQDSYNLNCPMSVTRSACYFVVRCITEPDLPASGGAFAPVTVTAPEGCLVHAVRPAAVVAGNTETSSRIVDVLFRALGGHAQGQGTMNNVALGNDHFTYYETTGGGQGACADADGPSGVHVAMSNTLMTPVEAVELSYPLRVERWHLRIGSGGAGTHRGGDGVVRELRVLEDCRLSVLAERRAHGPHGADGGEDGAPGRTLVNGKEQPAKVTRQLHAGDVVRIETPGGGGFGRA
jgi:N-methylhydantoinase B